LRCRAGLKHTRGALHVQLNKDHGGDRACSTGITTATALPVVQRVVRALIYLQSDATYKVVFGDSRVEKAFATYEFGLIGLSPRLHWVEGQYNPADRQRILLSATPGHARNATLWGRPRSPPTPACSTS